MSMGAQQQDEAVIDIRKLHTSYGTAVVHEDVSLSGARARPLPW